MKNAKTFLMATGSWFDFEEIQSLAWHHDFNITGAYGFNRISEMPIASRSIPYLNPFCISGARPHPNDLQPHPSLVQVEELRLYWDAQRQFHAYAYKITPEWMRMFTDAAVDVLKKTPAAGIFIDDWKTSHRWWDMDEEDYALVHPENLREMMVLLERELVWAATETQKFILFNGNTLAPRPRQFARRFWEGFGRSYNSYPEVVSRCQGGDFIYVNTRPGPWRDRLNRWLACWLAERKDLTVGLGLPDGDPLVSNGQLMIEMPCRWARTI